MQSYLFQKKYFILLVLILIIFVNNSFVVFAQEKIRSNTVCTNVGNATGDSPCISVGGCSSAPSNPSDLRQSIISDFGVTMDGYSNKTLQWAWEKFCDVSKTKFNLYVRNTIIKVTAASGSQQVGCYNTTSVLLGEFADEETFKLVLIHELGHVIRNCVGHANNQYSAHLQAYNTERGVSHYANNAPRCTGSDNLSEDYAEMIAYYLNPLTTRQTAACSPVSVNPNMKTNYPIHYNIAREILGEYGP